MTPTRRPPSAASSRAVRGFSFNGERHERGGTFGSPGTRRRKRGQSGRDDQSGARGRGRARRLADQETGRDHRQYRLRFDRRLPPLRSEDRAARLRQFPPAQPQIAHGAQSEDRRESGCAVEENPVLQTGERVEGIDQQGDGSDVRRGRRRLTTETQRTQRSSLCPLCLCGETFFAMDILFTPWRYPYLTAPKNESQSCIFCN